MDMFERPQHSLRELIQLSPLAIEELDLQGNVKLWNSAAERMFGWEESEVLGRPYPAIPSESRAEFEDEVLQLLGGATIQGNEVCRLCKDGRRLTARLWAAPIHNQRNEIIGIAKILEDITIQKGAEERLLLQATVLQATANSIVITDNQGTILWVNQAFSQLTGYSSGEAVGKNPRLLKSGEHDSAFYRNMWAAITSGNIWNGEVINRKKDGSLYTEEMTITPLHIGTGGITHYVAIKQNVTLRKLAEDGLRRAEEKYRLIFQNAPIGIFQATPEGRSIIVNPALARMHGYDSPEQLMAEVSNVGHQLFVDPNALQEIARLLEKEPVLRDIELEIYDKGGKRRWLSAN
ncbi:MAG TPA: PAS domain S-box protein, partial [Candidatus Limnocylindrales bacterium]|nr:PAS domain S-box protein [Candidatus Limnocylindrales bacterium]